MKNLKGFDFLLIFLPKNDQEIKGKDQNFKMDERRSKNTKLLLFFQLRHFILQLLKSKEDVAGLNGAKKNMEILPSCETGLPRAKDTTESD